MHCINVGRKKAVSIHASAKEATENIQMRGVQLEVSIHASAKEATECRMSGNTHICFNPRLREGGDSSKPNILQYSTPVSIHASAKEATELIQKCADQGLFQSTPPRRRRHKLVGTSGNSYIVSIHASAKEATCPSTRQTADSLFQSTPPRRRRLSQ